MMVITQGSLPHYRVPLFDEIARNGVPLTVVHSGAPTKGAHLFSEERVVQKAACGLYWQQIWQHCSGEGVYVVMFNPRWLTNVLLSLLGSPVRKTVLWGIGSGDRGIGNVVRLSWTLLVDHVIVYSQRARTDFLRAGLPAGKITVAPNTVLVERYESCATFEKLNRLLFIGSLDRRKRLDVLFGAIARHNDSSRYPVELVIIGDGAMLPELRTLAAKLRIADRIIWVGGSNDDGILFKYGQSSLASISPGQAGLSVLKSFAVGLPFMTARDAISGGEIENIVDEANGILFECDIESLADHIRKLVNDKAYARRLGAAAYEHYWQRRKMEDMSRVFVDVHARLTASPTII